MRILLTNNTLAAHAGSELYIRDLAVELMRRGHQPVAYSTQLGAVAGELRAATIPVIDRLELLGEPPDIIHGQHHYETLSALLRFPGIPALYYCHGWLPWEEATLLHPNIHHYVAVDELCRERLIAEGGIDPERIEVILNFFDERLFPPRTPLPRKPKLALIFSNDFREGAELNILKQACARHGIELHVRGLHNGNPTARPGSVVAAYDIVFAKARSAIEAMAVGAAVVLCSPGRLGPMVTSGNFAPLRQWNFGIRTLDRPLDVDLVAAELGKYDSADAGRVSQLTRDACELQPAVDRILDLYQRVIVAARHEPADSSRVSASAARYLERWAPVYKNHFGIMADRDLWYDRCRAAEQALTEREHSLSSAASAAESALAEQRRLREDAERQAGHMRDLLSCRDADVARLSRELASMRASATWRWTQGILQSSPVQLLLGGLIRSVARHRLPVGSPTAVTPRGDE
jgi:hypothetical protein